MRSSSAPQGAVTKACRGDQDPSGESKAPATRAIAEVEKPLAKRVSLSQIVRWKLEGLTNAQIARRVGCSQQNIQQRLKDHWSKLDGDQLEAYRDHRVALFTHAERAALTEMLNPGRLQNASLRDLTIAFGTIYDKGRLETGQSTANVALHALVESIERERTDVPSPDA